MAHRFARRNSPVTWFFLRNLFFLVGKARVDTMRIDYQTLPINCAQSPVDFSSAESLPRRDNARHAAAWRRRIEGNHGVKR
jgi:hypothetical protein